MSSSIIPSLSSSIAGTFAGVSKFATSLQSVLSRSVGIAALPFQFLNAGLNTLTGRQRALQSLEGSFLSLQQTVSVLQGVLNTSLLSSSVSDGSIVSASIAAGASAGTYSVEVESLGSYSTGVSVAGSPAITNPSATGISAATSFTLHTGSATTTITPTSTSLASLVSAINEQASDKVQATLVNLGSTSAPDYRLSLRAVKLGTGAVDIRDTSGSRLSSATPGALASYKVNGLAGSITTDSRSITLGPGITAELLSQSASGKASTVTVSNNTAGVSSALNSFARAYNSAVDSIAQHRGEGGGALRGESLLLSLAGTLGRLSNYSTGSPAESLAAFGLGLDKTGHLALDSTIFADAAKTSFTKLLKTLGESETGGFLKTATDLLGELEDPVTGTLKSQGTVISEAITSQKKKIAVQQERVINLQNNLTAQLAKADAVIARLESQVNYITGLFAAFTSNSSRNR